MAESAKILNPEKTVLHPNLRAKCPMAAMVDVKSLKELKADVHVLTLTATPIPRTLQLALAGVRDMSIIASPPVDRLAVRTFVMPYDPVVLREAILRERFRGGQTFYVCPRVADIEGVAERLQKLVPDIAAPQRWLKAHGRDLQRYGLG